MLDTIFLHKKVLLQKFDCLNYVPFSAYFFCIFSSSSLTNIAQNLAISLDGVFAIRNLDCWMVGADESTELVWQYHLKIDCLCAPV